MVKDLDLRYKNITTIVKDREVIHARLDDGRPINDHFDHCRESVQHRRTVAVQHAFGVARRA